jgi:penicillin-binding protein 2
LGGNDFGCWSVHGRLGIVDAISQSCDVFFYRTIQRGSLDGLAAYAKGFGLGSPLLSILPGENGGLVPDRMLLDSLYGPGGWGLGNLLNVAIGQGELLVTPLQMAVMTGVFASSGDMPGLRLVREIPASEAPWRDLALSAGTVETVVEGMREAVYSGSGTLGSLSTLPWEFFGKSGTAESPAGDHAWVVGFIREPRTLAIAVVIEHGGHGGAVAAPVVSRILTGYLGEGE